MSCVYSSCSCSRKKRKKNFLWEVPRSSCWWVSWVSRKKSFFCVFLLIPNYSDFGLLKYREQYIPAGKEISRLIWIELFSRSSNNDHSLFHAIFKFITHQYLVTTLSSQAKIIFPRRYIRSLIIYRNRGFRITHLSAIKQFLIRLRIDNYDNSFTALQSIDGHSSMRLDQNLNLCNCEDFSALSLHQFSIFWSSILIWLAQIEDVRRLTTKIIPKILCNVEFNERKLNSHNS